jgi:hypothetical protein
MSESAWESQRKDVLLLGYSHSFSNQMTIFGNGIRGHLGIRLIVLKVEGMPDGSCKIFEPGLINSHAHDTVVVVKVLGDPSPDLGQDGWTGLFS